MEHLMPIVFAVIVAAIIVQFVILSRVVASLNALVQGMIWLVEVHQQTHMDQLKDLEEKQENGS